MAEGYFCFMTGHGHTLPPKIKIAKHHAIFPPVEKIQVSFFGLLGKKNSVCAVSLSMRAQAALK